MPGDFEIMPCRILFVMPYYNVVCALFSERHDAIFIVGALDEAIVLRGLRYHPIDIENSVMRSHRKISEW